VYLQEFVGDKINAGIYVLAPSVLDRIELRPTSIEREVFPHVAADKKLFAFTLPGYWMVSAGLSQCERQPACQQGGYM
jgi:mannose-1-phosphate guanylyltransferase